MADLLPTALSGSFCALATPFVDNDDSAIDGAAFERLIDYQIAGGTRGMVIAGSTGEAAALDDEEFCQLVSTAVARIAGRAFAGAGTGQQSTRKTIAMSRRAADCGVDFVLVVTPPYVRPTQEGLYRHFMDVADHAGVPVMLYNVPARTGCDLLPDTVARLAGHGNIIGIKEARPEAQRIAPLLALKTPAFAVFSGDDGSCADSIRNGADGVISVSANVAPAAMQQLVSAALAGSRDMDERDAALQPLHHLLGVESNPIPVKWCLSQLGIASSRMRLPLLSLGTKYHAQATAVLESLQLTPMRR